MKPTGRRVQKKTELKRHFSKALRELRAQRGWTQGDLARHLGVTTGAVGNWETQANGVTVRKMKLLSDKAGLPIEYFRGGSPAAGAAAIKGGFSAASERGRRVPVITWARAERANTVAELGRTGGETIQTDCPDSNCFGMVAEGDSMEPEVLAGDILVFAPGSEPRNGDLVLCRLKEGGKLLLRRYRRRGSEGQTIRLISVNPDYKPLEFQAKELAFSYPAVQLNRKFRG